MPEKSTTTTNSSTTQADLEVDFRSLFAALPARYIVFAADDPTFTIIAENEAHASVAFVKPEEAIGRPLFDVFPDTSEKFIKTGVSDLVESFRHVIKTKKPDAMPMLRYDLKKQDGTVATKYWQVTHYPLFRQTGKQRTVYAIFQATDDITEAITADKRLQTAQRQLEEVLSAELVGSWIWDIGKNVVIGDKYMADMFGVKPETAAEGLPLQVFTDSIHPDDQQRVIEQIQAALKSSDIFESEYRTVGRDGSTNWVIARGRIERSNDGKPINFPGVLVDITERKQVENNLSYLAKASAVLSASLDYNTTLQSITELMVPDIADWCTVDILGPDGQLEQVALAHKDPAQVKWARELREKQGPPDLTDETNGTAKVMKTGAIEYYPHITDELLVASAKSKEELKLLRSLNFTSVIIVPIIIDDKPLGAITLISSENKRRFTRSDVEMATELANRASLAISNARLYDDAQHELRERKRLEEELRITNEQLENRVNERTAELEEANLSLQRSNQELQDFAYVASHDLQEPLRKIQAFGNLLQGEFAEKIGPTGGDYLVRMRNAAARMSVLIEDILSFSRVTTKGREFTPVNLRTIVHEVIDDLEVRISETNATITVGDLPTIHADAMQMRQLFQNLIANALKFHRENVPPVIAISASVEIGTNKGKLSNIKVADNGLGFDEKYLGRIFAVFQRLHSRDTYGGTGIGLAVCRKIVERHGGSITASSVPDKGSTFAVMLPMRHKKGENLL